MSVWPADSVGHRLSPAERNCLICSETRRHAAHAVSGAASWCAAAPENRLSETFMARPTSLGAQVPRTRQVQGALGAVFTRMAAAFSATLGTSPSSFCLSFHW